MDGIHTVDRVTPDGIVTLFRNGQPDDLPFGDFHSAITTGPDGALWYVDVVGSIGRITTDGDVTLFPLPNPNHLATSIVAGPDGALWFADGNAIGRITTDGTIEEFPSTVGADLDDLTVGPDGNVWFSANFGRQIGRITPDGQQTYFTLPTLAVPFTVLTAGPDGALWFDEDYSNRIGRITTDGTITEYPIPADPSEFGPEGGFPVELTFGDDGTLWYSTGTGVLIPIDGGPSDNLIETREIDRVDPSDIISIDAQAAPISDPDGSGFDGVVATFQPIDPGELAGDFSAAIDWGDGGTSTGVVTPDGSGGFLVDGSHDFASPGSYDVTVTLTSQRTSLLPIVLPTVVQDAMVVSPTPAPAAAPTPSPTPDPDPSPTPAPVAPFIGPIPIDRPTPLPRPVGTPSTPPPQPIVVPSTPPVPPTTAQASPIAPGPESDRATATVKAKAKAVGSVSPTDGVEPTDLVYFDPPATSSASSSTAGSSTVLPAASAETGAMANPVVRALKPVPTVGIASPKLPGARRASRPAPRPPRFARVDLPVLTVDVDALPATADRSPLLAP